VADRLDLPFFALDFSDEFGKIQDYFVEEYLNARTPNPCVVCNTWLKFGKLWEYAKAVGADGIATGHYAQAIRRDGQVELHRGVDPAKDQSYFLFGLKPEILARVYFPIGGLNKTEVRQLAEEWDLGVQKKPDSQEICFVPDGDHHAFVQRRRPNAERSGEIVDHEGHVVGSHTGLSKFTIGQRKGLGVALGEPRYIVELDPSLNRVVIGPQELLRRSELLAENVNWLIDAPPTSSIECKVKIRYHHEPASATLEHLGDGRVRVRFADPQTAITPGQATVFYSGDRVLGGGWIAS
jgi:tRNA-specific 2-thiouridylase